MHKSAGARASKTVWLTACAACRSASHAADKRADTHVAYEPLKALDGGSTPPISTKQPAPGSIRGPVFVFLDCLARSFKPERSKCGLTE